jgi:hypothetical protein
MRQTIKNKHLDRLLNETFAETNETFSAFRVLGRVDFLTINQLSTAKKHKG